MEKCEFLDVFGRYVDVSSVAWTLSAWNASTGLFLQRDSMESIGCGLKSEYEYQAVKAYVWKHGEYLIHSVSALLGEVGWVGVGGHALWTFMDVCRYDMDVSCICR